MKIHIKNMVCDRCKMVVKQVLEAQHFPVGSITLGEAEILAKEEDVNLSLVRTELEKVGFELLGNKKDILVEKIKTIIIEKINLPANSEKPVNFSDYLADKTGLDYFYLSHAFSSTSGTTIEKFIIDCKIKRVKELLGYDELTVSEIAYELGYSSVQALSNQFKKVVSMTPVEYKKSLKTG